jgi:hypothetical protein
MTAGFSSLYVTHFADNCLAVDNGDGALRERTLVPRLREQLQW